MIPDSKLKDSRFWYHAEVFDTARIREIMDARRGLDIGVLERFPNPLPVCYYLFFPGHLAPLEGCESTFIGKRFGSYGGDPTKQKVRWPSDGVHVGYDGRWGPRVANDPRGRRAGMRFPNFAGMFFTALPQQLSK